MLGTEQCRTSHSSERHVVFLDCKSVRIILFVSSTPHHQQLVVAVTTKNSFVFCHILQNIC